jgi:hypothetical protein
MPYLGGATLDQILARMSVQPPARRTGRQLVEILDQIQEGRPIVLPAQGPFRRYLQQASYVEAVCWIGACLADGPHYAHERGLVQLDVKPSNALLASDGQPMLLGFHLARAPLASGSPPPDRLGGTPDYAAPEQCAAMVAVREGHPLEAAVDGRADVYALGVLLKEALGRSLSASETTPLVSIGGLRSSVRTHTTRIQRAPLHRRNPRVSVGLSDILAKCLCQDPDGRYPTAAALAADLRRHLEDQPLLDVPNRSLTERWREWRRRRPFALGRGLAVAVAGVVVVAVTLLIAAAYRQRVHDLVATLAEARADRRQQRYAESAAALRRGLALASWGPGFHRWARAINQELAQTQWDAKGEELHRLAEFVRFRHGLDPPPAGEAEGLARRTWALWQAREGLLHSTGNPRGSAIRNDLRDVIVTWADSHVRLAAAAEADRAKREALDVLDEAAARLGPSPALDRERRLYARAGPIPRRGPRSRATVRMGTLRPRPLLLAGRPPRAGGCPVPGGARAPAAGLLAQLLGGALRVPPGPLRRRGRGLPRLRGTSPERAESH